MINLSEKSAFTGSFWKSISVEDCQAYLGFLSQTFVILESGFLPLHTCFKEPYFGKTCICSEIRLIIIVVKNFSASCVSFKKMLSVYYGKCILPTYPEWNIRQAWEFNILWPSSKTKFFVFLNARHREICLRYMLWSFSSVLFQSDILCFWFIYSRFPNKRPPRLFFFSKNPSPTALLLGSPPLLSFLLCESNTLAIYRKKYLLGKNVISKASLKISIEVNIHV